MVRWGDIIYILSCVLAGALTFHGSLAAAEEVNNPRGILKSASEDNYPPFSYLDDTGTPTGFSIDLLRATAAVLQYNVQFRTGDWDTVKSSLQQGEVQVLPLVGRTAEREAYFDFSIPYMTLQGGIVVRKGTDLPNGIDSLKDKRVAVMKSDVAEEFLKRTRADVRLISTPSYVDALHLLANKGCDAVVMLRLVALRLLQSEQMNNLEVLDTVIPDFTQDFCFAVRDGDKDTLALLNEGLAIVIADGTYRRLHAKWFASLDLPATRKLVFGGDANFPPYEFLDEKGNPQGFNVEITNALARALGLDIEIRLGPWSEIRRALENKEIDAIQGMFFSPEREKTFDFSLTHTSANYVVVGRKEALPLPETLEDLVGKQIAVEQGDIAHDHLVEMGLEEQLTTVLDAEAALAAVANGTYDVTVVGRRTALYLIQKNGWHNLAVGKKPLMTLEYGFAVPEGHLALLALVNEGLQQIKESGEYRRIYEKWLGVYDPEALHWRTIIKYVAVTAVPLVFVLLMALAWLMGTRAQVTRRTKELRASERERHSLEQQLIQAQKMEAIGRLAGGIAHDFNNILGLITGYAELALMKISNEHPARDDVQEILNAAKRSANITRQLLAFARRQPISPKVLNLNETIESTLKMLQRLMGEDIDLVWSPANNLWHVKIDPSQIDQILANLCVNARDAIESNGKVTIETANVTIDDAYCNSHFGFKQGEYVMLAVSDDGVGMPADVLAHIFEPFFTTKAEGKGTGLGLATVYGIVRQNQGFINVYSEPQKGTTFKVYLPRYVGEEEAAALPTTEKAVEPSKGETILVVEDEPAILKVSTLMLGKLGYRVLAASNPKEALQVVESSNQTIDMLVTDVVMPEMNGRELAEKLKEKFPNLRVLFMSGYTANVIVHHSVLDKSVSFIQKPFLMTELAAKIRETMNGDQPQ